MRSVSFLYTNNYDLKTNGCIPGLKIWDLKRSKPNVLQLLFYESPLPDRLHRLKYLHSLSVWAHSSLFMAERVQRARKLTCVRLSVHLSTAAVSPAGSPAPEHIRHRANYPTEQKRRRLFKNPRAGVFGDTMPLIWTHTAPFYCSTMLTAALRPPLWRRWGAARYDPWSVFMLISRTNGNIATEWLKLDPGQQRCSCVWRSTGARHIGCVCVCGFWEIELLKSSDVKHTQWVLWWKGSSVCMNEELFKLFLSFFLLSIIEN